MLFGHPLPARAERELPEVSPLDAMTTFPGQAAIIRFAGTQADAVPGDVEEIVLPGKLSTPPGPKEQARLAGAAVRWVASSVPVGAAP